MIRRPSAADLLLTVSAGLGLLSILVIGALWVTGTRPLVVESASMQPSIDAGDLVLTRTVPAGDLRQGDVVSVVDDRRIRVTHRVETIEGTGSVRTVRLRGDANEVVDPHPHVLEDADRVVLVLPHLGRVAAALDSMPARVLAVAAVAGCWVVVLRRRRCSTTRPRHRAAVLSGLLAMVALLPLGVGSERAWAVFADSATVESSTLVSHQAVGPPDLACREVFGLLGLFESAQLRWTHVDTRYEYAWEVIRVDAGVVVASGAIRPAGGAGETVEFNITNPLLALGLGIRDYEVEVTARLRDAPSWASEPTTARVRTVSLVLGLTAQCG
ncbi:signal peptidase I [uncultured Aeromicrobium sp.]|uniref:signal peptidase I n=1 Tax=uncultured Aeromicrobium sp. TaxID=337820 RepID=UPI0025D3037A|nr:signal peptidase I [uncultured Aeromicrobium sp.]